MVSEHELAEAERQEDLDRARLRGEHTAAAARRRDAGWHASIDADMSSMFAGAFKCSPRKGTGTQVGFDPFVSRDSRDNGWHASIGADMSSVFAHALMLQKMYLIDVCVTSMTSMPGVASEFR